MNSESQAVTSSVHWQSCDFDHKFTRRLSTSEVLLCFHYALCRERILFVNINIELAILDQSKKLAGVVKNFCRSWTIIFLADHVFTTKVSRHYLNTGDNSRWTAQLNILLNQFQRWKRRNRTRGIAKWYNSPFATDQLEVVLPARRSGQLNLHERKVVSRYARIFTDTIEDGVNSLAVSNLQDSFNRVFLVVKDYMISTMFSG